MVALNKNGFSRKTYSDLVEEMETKFREQFGEDTNLSSYTPLGIIMRVMAFFYAKLWDVVEAVYNSRFIKKATGVSLDYHGSDKQLPRNPATNSYVHLVFTGKPGYIIQSEETFSTEGDIQFALLEDVELDASGNGSGEAISVDTGAYTRVLANTVTIPVESDDNISNVTNPEPATGGTDIESDSSYQARLLKSNESSGKSTVSAVEAAVNNVTGVRSANVIFNKTMETDSDGNPPKSLHAFVLGGAGLDIAQALFDNIGATTETVGTEVFQIADHSGGIHPIRFDYAEEIEVYANLKIKTNFEFEADGLIQIKNKLISIIGGVDTRDEEQQGLSMGDDVILSKLIGAAYQVNGMEDVEIEIGTDSSNLIQSNLVISPRQVARTDAAIIEVTYA